MSGQLAGKYSDALPPRVQHRFFHLDLICCPIEMWLYRTRKPRPEPCLIVHDDKKECCRIEIWEATQARLAAS